MKLFTYWWGVHIVAEDDVEEIAFLRDLYRRLQNPSEKESYEEGDIRLYLPYKSTIKGDFSYKIEDGDVVLEINR